MEKVIFEIGDEVEVVNNKPLKGNEVGPKLIVGELMTVIGITLDRDSNQHLDVGIKSELNYVTSYETGESLPDGHKIHWCHPSRFVKQ